MEESCCGKTELDYKSCIGGGVMKIRNILYADSGKVLTDGKIYGKEILLEIGRTAEEFHEITEENYKDIVEKEEAENAEN